MNIYRPTWLYIKQHNQTGLKYFGKHTGADPIKYAGSGKYWKNHLAAHGNDVTTTWCQLFEDKESLVEYALKFSEENNIVESKEWANLKPESGIDGAFGGNIPYNKGKKASPKDRAATSKAMKKVASDPKWIEENKKKMLAAWQDPAKKENMLKRKPVTKELSQARSLCASEGNKKSWADPIVRAKRIAGMREAKAKKKAA